MYHVKDDTFHPLCFYFLNIQTTNFIPVLQNTDRRRRVTRKILSKYLNDDELVQYDSFLVNLIKYITDLKETEQRIQLGEEQLVALNDNLNIST